MLDIESERLGLHGEYDSVFGVFARGDDVVVALGGALGDADAAAQIATALASMLPRLAEVMGVPFADFMYVLTKMGLKGVPHEEVRDTAAEADDAEAVRALAVELGVEVPE